MKFIKYSFAVLSVVFFSSCLKSKNDLAGLREDPGGILTSITEAQYLSTDANVIGFGWQVFANFSFTGANENVRFFALHVSQPRSTKMSGSMKVKISMVSDPNYDAIPAGAVTIPAEIEVPASTESSFDFPVKLAVNKSLLDPAAHYAAIFTITSVSQGVYSENDKSIQVVFNEDPAYNQSKYTCVYSWTSTVQDPANEYSIINNKKPVALMENAPNELDIVDWYALALTGSSQSYYLWANNTTTGANKNLFRPHYILDATGKITSITSLGTGSGITVANIALDGSSPNKLVYTSNDDRVMEVKYTFDMTTTINTVVTTRKVTVTEKYVYNQIQAMY